MVFNAEPFEFSRSGLHYEDRSSDVGGIVAVQSFVGNEKP
jgi:hypothetical protein